MPALTKFQDFLPVKDRNRVLNHAILYQGIGTTDFYFAQIDPATGEIPIAVSVTPPIRLKSFNAFLDYSATPVNNSAWVQVIADTGAAITTQTFVFDGGGYPMVIGIGAPAAETDFFYLAQGGWDAPVEVRIPPNSRLSVKCLIPETVDMGYLVIAAFT